MIDRQFIRYLVVGVFNTGLTYLVYCLLLWSGLRFQWANFGAVIVGILIGFTTQSRFVFANGDWRKLLPFALVWGVMYAINIALIWALKQAGLNDYIAGLAAMPFVVVIAFLVQKFIVFRVRN
jgi:putative flippase GtrA